MTTVITAKLSLAVRLLDTTTGKEITDSNIHFTIDDNPFNPLRKGDGTYVFVNIGKEEFLMQINAYGYEKMCMKVNSKELDPKLPMIDFFLMPQEKNRIGGEVLEVRGSLSKLEYIEAINLDRPICLFHSSNYKKEVYKLNLLSMTAGGGVILDSLKYAVLDEANMRYDCFTVTQQDSPSSVVIKEPMINEHKLNDKIYRIIYGRASPSGAFILRVRDDAGSLPYLIHFKADDKEYFRKLDFHLDHGIVDLLDGATLVNDLEDTVETKEEEEKENE